MRRVVLFAKRPRPGKAKTRLCPPLRPEQAAALYRAFLVDLAATLRGLPRDCRVEWWWDGEPDAADRDGLALDGFRERVQVDGDLGARLVAALAAEPGPVVVIGADSPTLDRGGILDAFARLAAGSDAAIAPADDGGYVLLALAAPRPELFDAVPWSGPEVLRVTLERAAEHGLRVALLPAGYDVDDAADLARLRRDLERPAVARRLPETARRLAELPV